MRERVFVSKVPCFTAYINPKKKKKRGIRMAIDISDAFGGITSVQKLTEHLQPLGFQQHQGILKVLERL